MSDKEEQEAYGIGLLMTEDGPLIALSEGAMARMLVGEQSVTLPALVTGLAADITLCAGSTVADAFKKAGMEPSRAKPH